MVASGPGGLYGGGRRGRTIYASGGRRYYGPAYPAGRGSSAPVINQVAADGVHREAILGRHERKRLTSKRIDRQRFDEIGDQLRERLREPPVAEAIAFAGERSESAPQACDTPRRMISEAASWRQRSDK